MNLSKLVACGSAHPPIQTIDLPDRDGLRLVQKGHTSGGYAYTCQANPLLAAEAVARKHLRAAVKEQNWRRWS